MAHFVKNGTNFHGRSKTRVVENPSSKKKDIAPKNYGNGDDGWGSVPKNSGDASNCADGWGDISKNNSTSDNAWEQDRLVYGKAERNRRFRSNSNSTFRVPNQSRPNCDENYEEFPALGSRTAPKVNVWEKRQEKFEEMKAIEPTNETEEERMIQKAIELSKMEINHEEEKRRQLEEEYRLQTQLLEANPDMFEEFRLGEETYKAVADKFVTESYGVSNGYGEEFPNDEIGKNSIDHVGSWDSTSEKNTKNKDLRKEQKNYESLKEEDSNPQLEQDSGSQPPANTAVRKSSYSGARPKISKVVDMFGGWGTAKPAATAFHRDNAQNVPNHRSTKWDTVDVEFASKSSSRKPFTVKPTNKLSSPDPPEVKIDNTYSNWDTSEAETTDKLSSWNTAEVETSNKLSSWETETASKLSDWNTVKTIDANLRNSLTVTSESENCKVPSVESHQQEDIMKVTSKDENWGSDYLEVENSSRASGDNFELNSENFKHRYTSGGQKDKKLVSQSEQKSKADFKTQSKDKSLLYDMKDTTAPFDEKITSESGNDQISEMNKHEYYQLENSEQSQSSSIKSARDAEIKAKINSIEGKCFDSHTFVESDYAFLLNNTDPNYSSVQLEILNKKSKIQTEDLHNRNTSSFSEAEHQLGIPQLVSQTALSFGLLEDDTSKDLPIPGPHPLCTNYKETPSLPTKGQVDNYDLPLSKNGGTHIDPPKAAVATPELFNPVFPPQPMMMPLMNPALMMGMNPMLMQQMMMLSNPFFVQQWQQMDMYYKSKGMTFGGGMPIYPQPMPLLNSANNPQVFSNLMENCGPSSAAENGMIPSPFPTSSASSPPGINASHLLTEEPYEVDQPDDDFWFKPYLPSDSSLIPPPKPTPVCDPENLPGVAPEPKINSTASLSFGATSMCNEDLSSVTRSIGPIPGPQPNESSNRSPEVPYTALGWGDIETDSKSNEASSWCDNTDGWGSERVSTSRSLRNPSCHITEKKTACRQPASRPNLGHY